ncbi:hypothetical protein AB0M57_18065 [Streptomyces sp. NPDC051597]|uniref:hypothetical protein n=1 Tax=Streptomyces sp. NPDC051597 TaxID=3155049 RepID=UPI00344061DC
MSTSPTGSTPGEVHGTTPPAPSTVVTPEITHAECRKCGTRVAGLDGRYACGVCGWTNDWSEGHRPLPRAEDDPDFPGPGIVPENPLADEGGV